LYILSTEHSLPSNHKEEIMATQTKKRKWIKWVVIAVIIVVIGAVAFTAIQASARLRQAKLQATANSVLVKKGDISVLVQASGSIKPLSSATVYAPLNAQVSTITVKNGDTVKTGDVLMTLSSATIDDEITALQSTLSSQDAQILMANKSKSSSIISPVSGRVKIIYAVAGQDVATTMSAQNCIMILSADDKMELRFVPSAAVAGGDAVSVTIGDKTVDSTISTFANGEASILLADDAYAVGTPASIAAADGSALGDGTLSIHQPYEVIGFAGVVSDIPVTVNQTVTTGDTLVKLSDPVYSSDYLQMLTTRQNTLDQLTEKRALRDQLSVRASQDGVVDGLAVQQGTSVPEGTPLLTIGGTDVFSLDVAVDELDIANIKVGQPATIALDALSGSTYPAKVTRISGTGMYANGVTTYDVTIQLDPAKDIMTGMSARADIQVGSKTNVIVIPVNAIKTVDGAKYVVVVPDPGSKEAVSSSGVETKITIGLINGSYAEILTGLTEGQYVKDLSVQTTTGGLFSGMRQQNANSTEATA